MLYKGSNIPPVVATLVSMVSQLKLSDREAHAHIHKDATSSSVVKQINLPDRQKYTYMFIIRYCKGNFKGPWKLEVFHFLYQKSSMEEILHPNRVIFKWWGRNRVVWKCHHWVLNGERVYIISLIQLSIDKMHECCEKAHHWWVVTILKLLLRTLILHLLQLNLQVNCYFDFFQVHSNCEFGWQQISRSWQRQRRGSCHSDKGPISVGGYSPDVHVWRTIAVCKVNVYGWRFVIHHNFWCGWNKRKLRFK